MNSGTRRFLIEQTIGNAVLNALLNGFGTWQFFAALRIESVPLFGKLSLFGDIVGTSFILPFLVALTAAQMAHARMFRGLSRVEELPAGHALNRLPQDPAARAAVFGLLCALLFVPLLAGSMLALGVQELDLKSFCVSKAIFTGGLAGLIAPLAALRALTDAPAFANERPAA